MTNKNKSNFEKYYRQYGKNTLTALIWIRHYKDKTLCYRDKMLLYKDKALLYKDKIVLKIQEKIWNHNIVCYVYFKDLGSMFFC